MFDKFYVMSGLIDIVVDNREFFIRHAAIWKYVEVFESYAVVDCVCYISPRIKETAELDSLKICLHSSSSRYR